MKKKLFSAVLLLALATTPIASHAGFFDFFRTTSYSNSAQVRSSVLAYKKGDKADIILQVQKILAEQKMYDGDLSGLIGPKTELSIKAWQKAHGLPVSGLLDAGTITSILGRGGESVGGNRDGLECAGSAPQIMVTSPNGGESYQIGGQIEVTWETCNIPASELVYITIGTSANGQGHAFLTTGGTGTPNDGSETFTLSDTQPAGQYYVSAFRPAPNYLRDFSDNSFTLEAPMVCTPQSEPWVKVLSPDGGESYVPGQTVNVTWTSCNIPSSDNMAIVFNQWQPTNGASSMVQTPNDGSQSVTFDSASHFGTDPTDWAYGQNFKMSVVWMGNTNIRDYSDGLFSIISSGGDCVVNTEQINPFVSNIPSLNVAPFSDSYTNLYNEMAVFRIQNPTNCTMFVNKMAIISAATGGMDFVHDADMRLKTLDDGNVFSPTNPNAPSPSAWFTINDQIPANSYKDYSVGTSDIHYFDPFPEADNMNWGGIAVGVAQVDIEVGGTGPTWNGNTVNPSASWGPIWSPVITVQE